MYNYNKFIHWRIGCSGLQYSEWTADRETFFYVAKPLTQIVSYMEDVTIAT